jgi:Putative auto-transporter adhesin, head GIN domain
MKQLLALIALSFSINLSAQTKQTRTVTDFSGISSATGITVQIKKGIANEVIVSSSKDELVNNIKTEVDANGVLKIYYKNPNKLSWNNTKNVKLNAYVTYKSINSLIASSGSSMQADMAVQADALKIEVNSGAEMQLDIATAECSRIVASSGSTLKAEKLTIENCTATASSGAEIKVEVTKKLNGNASSGGSIKYKGNPTIESKKTSSGGEVKSFN